MRPSRIGREAEHVAVELQRAVGVGFGLADADPVMAMATLLAPAMWRRS